MTRKFLLILGFLCTVSLPVFSETFAIKFGDLPGGLEFQYEGTGRIAGTIKNTTPVSIGCNTETNDFQINLDPGAIQDFSWEKPPSYTLPKGNVDASEMRSWGGQSFRCDTELGLEYKNQSESKKFQWGTITGSPRREYIDLSLENNSDQPIEISWNESSLIDFDNSTKRGLLHSRTRGESIPNSVVPPRAKFSEYIFPKENYHRDMISYISPPIESRVPPASAERLMKLYTGKKMSLVLQLIIEGKKTPVTLEFELKSVSTKKPLLHPHQLPG